MQYINLSFVISACILLSCGGKSTKEQQATTEKKTEIEEFVKKEFSYPIPTSFEVSTMLSEANTTYDPSIVNAPDKVSTYGSTWQKATNLGIYGADLSYASMFEKLQETVVYLDISRQLIEELNISSAFNATMATRLEANIDNLDSLIYIVTESFYDTYNYLNNNGEEITSILVIAGSVIESLHITCSLIQSSENKQELMEVLATQKKQVFKLIELMDKHQSDDNIAKVLPNIRFISLVYEQLGNENQMTEGQLADITSGVALVRADIVQ